MKLLVPFLLIVTGLTAHAQPDRIKHIFPEGTTFYQNIPYANDTLKKHLLDLYLPPNAKSNTPVIIWLHGGAWRLNDKYADMSYMKNTINAILAKGYAIASVDYRFSTSAKFPAQIIDCNSAIAFIYRNATTYKLNKNKIALMGFSAGGHLASLTALSLNNNVKEFFPEGKTPSFKLAAVIDFYGPSNFIMFYGNSNTDQPDVTDVVKLLGVSPLLRPDVAAWASPVTYVDKDDPPFFIVHGENDQDVPRAQSHALKSYLDVANVKNQLTIVRGAPHYGEMFDQEFVGKLLVEFLWEVGF